MNTVYFAKPVVTSTKSIAIKFGLDSPATVSGRVHLKLIKSGAEIDIPFTTQAGQQELELDTHFIPLGNLANPEVTEGRVEIWTGPDFPYVITFTCRSVGFACEITSEHVQSVPLTLN